jgi:hypothetical protein
VRYAGGALIVVLESASLTLNARICVGALLALVLATFHALFRLIIKETPLSAGRPFAHAISHDAFSTYFALCAVNSALWTSDASAIYAEFGWFLAFRANINIRTQLTPSTTLLTPPIPLRHELSRRAGALISLPIEGTSSKAAVTG